MADLQLREPDCPKHMVYGPCGGVRPDLRCELADRPCPFTALVPYGGPAAEPVPAARAWPLVLTDLTVRPFDRSNLRQVLAVLDGTCDAVLLGEHQNRPDFPPTQLAAFIAEAGLRAWVTLSCRDRNRLVLEQELAGLAELGVDAVLCVTGDGRAPGIRPEVTQVFDLDGTRLTALATAAGLVAAVPEAPQAPPAALRPGRLLQKQRAGAQVCVLNHVSSAADLAVFVAAARAAGVTVPFVASVAVYTDARSAAVLQRFPGLELDAGTVESVLTAADPTAAGIDAAVAEARQLLAIDGVMGVNVSGLGSSRGELAGAEVKAAVGRAVLALP